MKSTIPQTGVMVLRPEVLTAINTTSNRLRLAAAMSCTENAIRNYISRNDVKLTQISPLTVIKEIMGVLEFGELLEQKPANV